MMRDYDYLQQRASIKVDLMGKSIQGTSELILAPKDSRLNTIRVHCRQCNIKSVRVNGIQAKFEHLAFLDQIVAEKYRDLESFDLFYRGSIVASKEGELIIHFPQEVRIKESTKAVETKEEGSVVGSVDTTEQEMSWDIEKTPPSTTDFEPLSVKIEYTLEDPKGGLHFILPDENNPERSPHMYSYCGALGGLCDGARTWLPCRDTLRDTCPFRLEFIVPESCVAISGGNLVEEFTREANDCMDDEENKVKVFRYVMNTPTNASSIGFAVGPFRKSSHNEWPRMMFYSLPEVYIKLNRSTQNLPRAMQFYESWIKMKYPFDTYRQVFVENPTTAQQFIAGATIIDQAIMFDETVLDSVLLSEELQVKAFVGSWISAAVGLSTTKDAWVLVGLIAHLVNIYVREVYGEDEYGRHILSAMDALTTLELVSPSLRSKALLSSEVDVYAEYMPDCAEFFEIKAPLVMHMMEQRVGKKHFCSAVQQIVGSAMADAATDETESVAAAKEEGDEAEVDGEPETTEKLTSEALSTPTFLRVVKSIAGASGQDLTKSFLTSWILEGGLPFFSVGFWYNRKQNQAEVVLQQEIPPGGKLYTGLITVTVVEDSGEYTYPMRVESKRHKWDFPCHNKVRKKRRKRQGLGEPDDTVSVVGPGMGLNDTPVYWVKLDDACGWLRHVVLHQPDFNCMEQLLSDKNIASRIQAVRSLALYHQPHEKPNVMSCRAITECMSGLTTHSHHLRAEAATSLAVWQASHSPLTTANTQLPIWSGMHNLIRIFKEHFYDRDVDMPMPNYFLPSGGKIVLEAVGGDDAPATSTNMEVQEYSAGEYEIKKGIPRACTLVRSQNGHTPPEIETFLLQLLRQNDNSKNYVHMSDRSQVVDDAFYIGRLILSLSQLNIDRPTTENGKDLAVAEIIRYLEYDQIHPSYGYIVTICCLEALCNLQLVGRRDTNFNYYRYASLKYATGVRMAAIESIVRLLLNEDTQAEPIDKTRKLFGPPAAFDWVLKFLEIEKVPSVSVFAVQVILDTCRGFPPRKASEVLSTWKHPYAAAVTHHIMMNVPNAFILNSPINCDLERFFQPISLDSLRGSTETAASLVNRMWALLNEATAYDQRLRIALIALYHLVWNEKTPKCLESQVQEKSQHWAGGYKSLKAMIEDARSRKQANRSQDRKRHEAPASSPPQFGQSGASLEQLKGKKLKLTIGETHIRSHKL